MIEISDEDIKYAESILLNSGQNFDDERRIFIRNLETIDLQAVPGSGKTTVLLAKLLILEKRLPLSDNRGILVISHTNTAIDEIKKRIGHHCPKLFSYPNFVGTIQSFVDNFLAIPAYVNKYKNKPIRIDNEIYSETIEKYFKYGKTGFSLQEKKNALYYNSNFNILQTYRFSFDKGVFTLKKSLNGEALEIKTPNKKIKKPFSSEELKRIEEWLILTKMKVMEAGILHYDDAYTLADVILYDIKGYERLIQNRFLYVFIDEMQDMEQHQFRLLETLFANTNSHSIFQRLGDINQSIFSGNVSAVEIWKQRENKLFINGSHRLSQPIANLVSRLSLTHSPIEGKGLASDGSAITLKPVLVKYDSENVSLVIPEFSKILKGFIENGLVPNEKESTYHAIGWRKNHVEDDKICLSDYFPVLKTSVEPSKIDFETLEDYLLNNSKDNFTLAAIRKSILSAFVKILRIEGIRDEFSRNYTITRLVNFIKQYRPEKYPDFELNLYNWSIGLIEDNVDSVKQEIKTYIPYLLGLFDAQLKTATEFVNNPSTYIKLDDNKHLDYYEADGHRINIGTVHSVKGQTHTATLYLETFFSKGYGSYESERLRNQFNGIHITETIKSHKGAGLEKIKQSAKMAYVGFSRPTHLLAIAIEKKRFESSLQELDKNEWDIIELKKTDCLES